MASTNPRASIDSDRSLISPRATGYPFPTQESPRRQVSSQRVYQRRGSAASIQSVNSIGGALDPHGTRRNSVQEVSENAISTLLAPPIVRTGLVPHTFNSAAATGFRAPTTRDIPPVALTNIPQVPAENFQHYLNTIGPLIETFERGRSQEQASFLRKDKELERTDRFAQALDNKINRERSNSPTLTRRSSVATLFSPPATPTTPRIKRLGSAQFRRNRNEPTPLSTIPPIYFEEDFHLEDPRTFDVVSENAEILRNTSEPTENGSTNGSIAPRKNLASNAILQEKLSWYMDTVEVHLISSISTASSGFFAALGSLKELQLEAEHSVAKIQRLREDLGRLDKELAVGGLEVAAKRRRRDNIRKLRQATDQVGAVVDAVKKTDELVESGRYDDAADQMVNVGRLVRGESDDSSEKNDLIDLSSLRALDGLQSGMQELQYRIGAGFAQRFTATLLADLRRHVEHVPNAETLKRWSRQRGIPPTYMETNEQFRKDLLASLSGLARCGYTAAAVAVYREAAIKEMKTIIRKYLPSSTDDDVDSMVSTSTRGGKSALTQQEKSSILARNLRALDPEDGESLLVQIYTSVSEALRRISTQIKVLLDVTSLMEAPSPRKSLDQVATNADGDQPDTAASQTNIQDDIIHALDISSLLGQAVDTAQTQLSRVLKVRNEQTIRLPRQRFMRYFNINRLFADECEAVSGRGGQALKGVINAQVSGFVQVLSKAEVDRITDILDAEKWDAVDLTADNEKILERVLGSVEKDAPEWTASTPIWEPLTEAADVKEAQVETNGTSTPTTNGNGTVKPQVQPATIDSNNYILVGSAIALLPTLDLFLGLTCLLPTLTPQISASLLDVLRTFNSRASHLILEAGARRTAGLKNITTKHLALASQALSFVIALVPYQRECIRRHLSAATSAPGQAVLAEWDKTKRLYQDHQLGIHDKLVEILTGRSQTHVKSMLALDFNSAAADAAGEGKPSPYMETLIKETLTLHRVLARHLSALEVGMIMRQIFSNYKEQWVKAFTEVEVSGDDAEKRLLRDVTAMEERLGRLEEFKDAAAEIAGVVKARTGSAKQETTTEVAEKQEEKAEKREDAA